MVNYQEKFAETHEPISQKKKFVSNKVNNIQSNTVITNTRGPSEYVRYNREML